MTTGAVAEGGAETRGAKAGAGRLLVDVSGAAGVTEGAVALAGGTLDCAGGAGAATG